MPGVELRRALTMGGQSGIAPSTLAAAATMLLQPCAAQPQTLTVLRALSSVNASFSSRTEGARAAAQQGEGNERRVAAYDPRRLSHYAASTSGRAGIASPALGRTAAGHQARAGARWRAFSSSSSSSSSSGGVATLPAAGARPRSASPERSFASQPAYAYEEPDYDAAAIEAVDVLQRAQAAVDALRAKAESRLAEARQLAEPLNHSPYPDAEERARRFSGQEEVADLVKVKEVEELAPEAPVWERLAHFGGGAGRHRGESLAALHLYRQEVQMGHDADVGQSGRSAFGHVPFLRSGLFAAQQGFGLQSELSRASVPARLVPSAAADADAAALAAAGAAASPVGPRTQANLSSLQLAMQISRTDYSDVYGKGEDKPTHVLAAAEAAVAAAAQRSGAAPPHAGGFATALLSAAEAAEADAAQQGPQDNDDIVIEAVPQGGILEALDWQERLRHENPGERAVAAQRLKERRRLLAAARAEAEAAEEGPGLEGVGPRCPVPSAPQEAVLQALHRMLGAPPSKKLARAIANLYSGRLQPSVAEPLVVLDDPAQCLHSMEQMVQLLVEELGPQGAEAVLCEAPWVTLLDPTRHGHLQLAALHLVDLTPQQRAQVVRTLPRMLQIDVDAGLLPMLEYLQVLGMSTEQLASVLVQDPHYAHPCTLPMLKSVVAFWRGKGLSRDGIVKLLLGRPQLARTNVTEHDLKFAWLRDHVGMTVEDMGLFGSAFYRNLTSLIGPRVAYAQQKGFEIATPLQVEAHGRTSPVFRTGKAFGLRRLVHCSQNVFMARVGCTEQEFEAFRDSWLQQSFSEWLQQRRPGIEHYRSVTCSSHLTNMHGSE